MQIIFSNTAPFAKIQLNRPQVRNSFNPEMILEITEAFKKIETQKDLRAVIMSGSGENFCAGADLQWMQSMINYTFEKNKNDAEELYQLFEAIENCSIPVIGKIHGSAYGGALGLIATCDYVIAESQTQICFSEVKLGLAPAVISSFVARKTFLSQVMPWMLSGGLMSAKQAMDMGLVNEVVNGTADLEIAVDQFAKGFLSCGPEAIRETKKMLRKLPSLDLQKQKELTTKVIAERRVSNEGQEGLKSFIEKRKPNWVK